MTVTRADALAALEAVCGEYPDRTNPRACVYTDRSDPTYHCVIGEVCLRLDLPIPAVDDDLNECSYDALASALEHDISPDAVELLVRCQRIFDGQSGQNPDLLGQKPWAECLEVCRRRGML